MTERYGRLDGWLDRGGGGLRWWSSSPPVVAPVAFAVAGGVVVETDVAEPARVLAWAVRTPADLTVAQALFGAPWRAGVDDAVRTGSTVVAAPPELPAAWARYALVRGVRRWLPLPLDEGLLDLDLAVAAHGVGRTEEATGPLSQLWATLAYRMEECAAGELPASSRAPLLAAARATAELLPGSRAAEETAARAVELEAASIIDRAPDGALLDVARGTFAGTRGGGRSAGSARPDLRARVDPRLVPARIARWGGADDHALTGVRSPDAVTAELALAAGVEPADRAVRELLVSLVDDDTGLVLACAPLAAGARATLPVRGEPGGTSLHVHRAATEHEFRIGEGGRLLIHVDRLLLEAWTDARFGLSATPAASRARDELVDLTDLTDLADTGDGPAAPAAAGLRWRAGRPTAADLTERLAVLDRYAAADPATEDATAPLIAEQVHLAGADG